MYYYYKNDYRKKKKEKHTCVLVSRAGWNVCRFCSRKLKVTVCVFMWDFQYVGKGYFHVLSTLAIAQWCTVIKGSYLSKQSSYWTLGFGGFH